MIESNEKMFPDITVVLISTGLYQEVMLKKNEPPKRNIYIYIERTW